MADGTDRVGGYRLLTRLGQGAYGVVWRGVCEVDGKGAPRGVEVAVKVLHQHLVFGPDGERMIKRFHREARLARKLAHPHVVRVLDDGEEGGRHFLVMELARGKSIADYLAENGIAPAATRSSTSRAAANAPTSEDPPPVRGLAPAEAVEILRQTAGVLQAASEIGLLHRDIKPDNLFIEKTTGDDGVERISVKMLDFGLAKDLSTRSIALSSAGSSLGTPAYMSPEQFDSKTFGEPDTRADLYSLGALAYHALTGRPPFPGPTPSAFMLQHRDDIPVAACAVNPAVPRGLSQVVDRLLAKRPDDRHRTPAELIEDLNRVERGQKPLVIHNPKRPGAGAKRLTRPVLGAGLAGLAALAALAVGGFRWWEEADRAAQADSARAARAKAQAEAEEASREAVLAQARKGRERRLGFETNLAAARAILEEGDPDRLEEAGERTAAARRSAANDVETAEVDALAARIKEGLATRREWAAVLTFEVDKDIEAVSGQAVAVRLEQSLGDRYRLANRTLVANALEELKFQWTDLFERTNADRFGRFVRARFAVTGHVVRLGDELTVAAQVVDLRTAAVHRRAEVAARDANELNALIPDLVAQLDMEEPERQAYVREKRDFPRWLRDGDNDLTEGRQAEARAGEAGRRAKTLERAAAKGAHIDEYAEAQRLWRLAEGKYADAETAAGRALAAKEDDAARSLLSQARARREAAARAREKAAADYRAAKGRADSHADAMAAAARALASEDWRAAEAAYGEALAVPGYGDDAKAREGLAAAKERTGEPEPVNAAPPPMEKLLSLDCGGGVMIEAVPIPAGRFSMGSTGLAAEAAMVDKTKAYWIENNQEAYDETRREVTLTKPFYLGRYEVTQAQWRAVMGTDPSRFAGDDNPVERVSWNEAVEFCRRLSAKTGRSVRLPTEAEWEYACRAGTTSIYHNGNDPEALALVGNVGDAELRLAGYAGELIAASDGYGDTTAPVGWFAPNGWGLYDMHGNVWEWCQDLFGAYDTDKTVDPQGAASGPYRVCRGGSWGNYPRGCRSASRDANAPDNRSDDLGFRVAFD